MKYFLAPRSGEKSYYNFQSTIKHGIPLERISEYLTPEEIKTLTTEDVIYAWGNRAGKRKAWERMNIGDIVIFYAHRELIMTGEVYFKKHHPEMALKMWPADEYGHPWEYTFFLRNLRYISIPMRVFNSIVGYKDNNIVMGFTEIRQEKIQNIVNRYGSVESMLGLFTNSNSNEMSMFTDQLHVNISNEVSPIVIEHQRLIPKMQTERNSDKKIYNKKVNYELKNRNSAIIGSKGEEIVFKYEKNKLEQARRSDLAKRVERKSLTDDTLGYDILSFTESGEEKYIEVKSSAAGNTLVRFFVSLNEYLVGSNKNNYFIYFVEDVNSIKPKITIIEHPIDESKFAILPDGYVFEAKRE